MPTVLLVDDDPAILISYENALWKQPFDIVTAPSAELALEVLATRPVDVVVSDQRMPEVSGAEFLARVRARYPDVQRIMLTGEADLETTVALINKGELYRFLTKPFASADLARTIQQALQLKRVNDERARLHEAARSSPAGAPCATVPSRAPRL
jgi:DNA-binding NtrC family response regulator